MTTEQKETLMKIALSTFGDIAEENQSYVLGFVNGLAQSRRSMERSKQ